MRTATRTRTASYTHTDVKYVNWKIRSDLLRLRGLYAHVLPHLTPNYIEDLSADLYLWVYTGHATEITLNFHNAGSSRRRYAIRYRIATDGSVRSDADPGGLRYYELGDIYFSVRVTPSVSYLTLSPEERDEFRYTLELQWGPGDAFSDGRGYWQSDRRYSSNGFGATRSVFRPY